MQFDPSEKAKINGNIFALPFTQKEARLVIIPAPCEITVSFRDGTSLGPEAILKASPQIDFYDSFFPEAWKAGIFMLPISNKWFLATPCFSQISRMRANQGRLIFSRLAYSDAGKICSAQ